VLLLNPDARIDGADVLELRRRLHAPDRRIAAVAPAQVDDDGQPQRIAWPFPSPGHALAESIGLHKLLRPREVFLAGSILLLSARALADVGRFDERFFLYTEETDWQRRALNRGWEVELVGDIVGVHEGGAASTSETDRELRFHASHERYIRKWYGERGWMRYRLAVIVGATLRSVVMGDDDARLRRRQALLYIRGPIGEAKKRGLR
jgi:GT2 family glycosyltransferase